MDPTRLPQVPYGPRFGDGVRQEPSMERRTFRALVSGGLLAVPLTAEAQQAVMRTTLGSSAARWSVEYGARMFTMGCAARKRIPSRACSLTGPTWAWIR